MRLRWRRAGVKKNLLGCEIFFEKKIFTCLRADLISPPSKRETASETETETETEIEIEK